MPDEKFNNLGGTKETTAENVVNKEQRKMYNQILEYTRKKMGWRRGEDDGRVQRLWYIFNQKNFRRCIYREEKKAINDISFFSIVIFFGLLFCQPFPNPIGKCLLGRKN